MRRHDHASMSERVEQEFATRALGPAHRAPEDLARALERERGITIELRAHASSDPGVYGMVYRKQGNDRVYIILYRPTSNVALKRKCLFHELGHILFQHELIEVGRCAGLSGYVVSDEDDAEAEAFAVAAMEYSLKQDDQATPSEEIDDGTSDSEFGRLLRRTRFLR